MKQQTMTQKLSLMKQKTMSAVDEKLDMRGQFPFFFFLAIYQIPPPSRLIQIN